MVENVQRGQAGSIASAIGMSSELVSAVPFAQFGLDILNRALNKWDELQKKPAVRRIMNLFLGDTTVSSLVAEGVARKMALYRQSDLIEEDLQSCHEQQGKGKAFGKVAEALQHAVNICLQKDETSFAKSRAAADAQFILNSIMNGYLPINAGIISTAAEKVDIITASIISYV
jgi:hypothetical protein